MREYNLILLNVNYKFDYNIKIKHFYYIPIIIVCK